VAAMKNDHSVSPLPSPRWGEAPAWDTGKKSISMKLLEPILLTSINLFCLGVGLSPKRIYGKGAVIRLITALYSKNLLPELLSRSKKSLDIPWAAIEAQGQSRRRRDATLGNCPLIRYP
jgi:hypothetical protein